MKLFCLPLAAVVSVGLLSPASALDMFGEGYKPCGDAASTPSGVDCVSAKTKIWDQRLNRDYAALQKYADSDQKEPLRTAQRLWIEYRDANCNFYGTQQGSIRDLGRAECLRAMTQDRALEFEDAMKP